jgi:hypothetical protein
MRNCFIYRTEIQTNNTQLDLIKKAPKTSIRVTSVKLNNKIYAVEQLKGFKTFSYKQKYAPGL